MVMDRNFRGYNGPTPGTKFNSQALSVFPDPNLRSSWTVSDRFLNENSTHVGPVPSHLDLDAQGQLSEGDVTEDLDFSDVVLKYINHILMEEDFEDKACMFQESAALQAAEKSFYDVIGERYPASIIHQQVPNLTHRFVHTDGKIVGDRENIYSAGVTNKFCPDENSDLSCCGIEEQYVTGNVVSQSISVSSHSSSSSIGYPDGKTFGVWQNIYSAGVMNKFCPDWNSDPSCSGIEEQYVTGNVVSQSISQSSHSSSSSSGSFIDGPVDSPVSTLKIPDIFSDGQSAIQFKKGVEEASRFLPSGSNLIVDLRYDESSEMEKNGNLANLVVKVEKKFDNEESADLSRGKKNPYHENGDLQGERSNKQSVVCTESSVSPDMFDKVLLCSGGKNESDLRKALQEVTESITENPQPKVPTGGKNRAKKQGGKRNVVDMRNLLTLCAQAVATDDRRTANEFLKQIRQHASPTGDGMQRLSHYFADGLEARMAGSGTKIYTSLINMPTSAADILKAYHIYLATCPFRKISNFFANRTIMNVSEKVTSLHIIHFGVLYGFQWPSFLQKLSNRPGGPPKLRITGIDRPCPGFRPSARVEETGRRLARYAETFKVPFEFVAIAQKWETIKIDDLKIKKDEMVVVNCLYKFRHLLDETVVVNSPRNIVLNLIRRMNPAVFVLGIMNGAFNAPFFITRFREAMFHYSTLFDMLDANIPREVHERMLVERIVFGRQAMNVVACEAAERIERPETYKQWQVRTMRAGFEQLPLDEDIMRLAKNRVRSSYHKDFVIDEDSRWLLQGWKGRILYTISSWRPAY